MKIAKLSEIEHQRVNITVTWFISIAVPFLLVFGTIQFFKGNYQLGWFLNANAFFGLVNYWIAGRINNPNWAAHAIVVQIHIIAFYLLITGGESKTGILWTYIMPNMTFFLLGFRPGAVTSLWYISIVTFLFFSGVWESIYERTVEIRYIATYLAVCLFASAFEYSRARSNEELKLISRQYKQLSVTDPLTQVYNRAGFYLTVKDIVKEKQKSGKGTKELSGHGVLILDIDHFKKINDTYGHSVGDDVIQQVAATLKSNVEPQAIVARWGGEEFLVLDRVMTKERLLALGETLRQAVADLEVALPEKEGWPSTLKSTISAGASLVKSFDIDTDIAHADSALYQAKEGGRNLVKFE